MFDLATVGHFAIDLTTSPRIDSPKPSLDGPPTYFSLATRQTRRKSFRGFRVCSNHEINEADSTIHLELDEKGKTIRIKTWNAQKSGLIKQVAKAIAKAAL